MKNFNREPFVVKFHSPYTAVKDFVLIPQHTCPNAAVKEIDALYDVAIYALNRWSTKNIMLLGDFNAGSKYVPKRGGRKSASSPTSFRWLITDNVDTTTKNVSDHFPVQPFEPEVLSLIQVSAPGSGVNMSQDIPTECEWLKGSVSECVFISECVSVCVSCLSEPVPRERVKMVRPTWKGSQQRTKARTITPGGGRGERQRGRGGRGGGGRGGYTHY
ncbi:hypothetical protein F7725_004047 [Dissostichus mawsoni]|uniref:Endonuclease/exonuclease/phosphatase domain-containing protein n=1 Tax=Dissostichus mawsoni TaxID=36200 RepID=A0A7J5YDW5_DISMA|nr:hypothetical protein F7725_004047 [Dissostichus mawsoni]